jgi:hypothetical protein
MFLGFDGFLTPEERAVIARGPLPTSRTSRKSAAAVAASGLELMGFDLWLAAHSRAV